MRSPPVLWLAGLAVFAACDRAREEPPADSVLAAVTRRAAPVAPGEKTEPRLARRLAAVRPDSLVIVVVDLREQLDPVALAARLTPYSRLERRALAVRLAGGVAHQAQRRIRPRLDSLQAAGAVADVRAYTVANRLVVRATPAAILALAEDAEVAALGEGAQEKVPATRGDARALPAVAAPSWMLHAIGADSARRLGLTGEGVVVGLIDAGASMAHEQLRAGFRRAANGWHDPLANSTVPTDALGGHGTGILSLAVGRDSVGTGPGVAPGAQWLACVGLQPGGAYHAAATLDCAEWLFTTAQPDVLIAAWSIADGRCDRTLETIVNAWRAAEILPVFPAGNEGPGEGTGGSPANYVGLYPDSARALSVGAIGPRNAIYSRSSRGPGQCDGGPFPAIVAPGESLTVAYPLTPTMTVRVRGTSYAAAVVAGAAALLREHDPEASVAEIERALRAGARDLGPSGRDRTFGAGALDIPRALTALDAARAASDDVSANRQPQLRP